MSAEHAERAGAEHAGHGEGSDHEKPRYMLVWGGLALLTAIEVGTAFLVRSAMAGLGLDVPERTVTMLIVAILIGLAIWKAALVALYFMHLKWETKALKWLAVAPIGPAIILVVVVLMEYV